MSDYRVILNYGTKETRPTHNLTSFIFSDS
ncbi:unnamed protein product [Oikopleura dioica]|uniref:Uncharacterized protein n=1 Tax=Oikopleura dioica TaxID=34765 RepID=E4XVR9_OIKDI|nr:unnamed protein product [Oikopleura dioica]